MPYPVHSNEDVVEATDQAQVAPGFTVQPDVEYVVRPGGGIPNPVRTDLRTIRVAAVFGVRAMIQH